MQKPTVKAMGAGLIAPLLLLVGAVPALAHGKGDPGGFAAVKGTVLTATAGSLQVQTQTGTSSFTLGARTHIIRVATGTMDDVKAGTLIDLTFAKGTTTVTGINVDALRPSGAAQKLPPSAKRPANGTKPAHVHIEKPASGATSKSTTHGTKPQGAAWVPHAAGIVVSVSSTSIVVKGFKGNATYTLSSSITVTKELSGKVTDLAAGQTVAVLADKAGVAFLVTILNA